MKHSDCTKDQKEKIGSAIVDGLSEETFTISGTPMATVYYEKTTSFKKKPLKPNAEFMLSRAYVGSKGTLNFCFLPVSAEEFTHVEMTTKEIDSYLPEFPVAAATAFEVEGERMNETLNRITDKLMNAAVAQKKAEESEKAKDYASIPNYGRF